MLYCTVWWCGVLSRHARAVCCAVCCNVFSILFRILFCILSVFCVVFCILYFFCIVFCIIFCIVFCIALHCTVTGRTHARLLLVAHEVYTYIDVYLMLYPFKIEAPMLIWWQTSSSLLREWYFSHRHPHTGSFYLALLRTIEEVAWMFFPSLYRCVHNFNAVIGNFVSANIFWRVSLVAYLMV